MPYVILYMGLSPNKFVTMVQFHMQPMLSLDLQVLMFSHEGDKSPSLVLGSKSFRPGNDPSHFCQPAAVAVEHSGTFYVADG